MVQRPDRLRRSLRYPSQYQRGHHRSHHRKRWAPYAPHLCALTGYVRAHNLARHHRKVSTATNWSLFRGFSRISTVHSSTAEKALSVGANTVKLPSHFNASTRPAARAAATYMDKLSATTPGPTISFALAGMLMKAMGMLANNVGEMRYTCVKYSR